MRCRALAEQWPHSESIHWVGRCDWPELARGIRQLGIELTGLPESINLPEEMQILREITSERAWIVLDGYDFDLDYESTIRREGRRLLRIDDFRHRERYEADVLLNQNPGSESLQYHINDDCRLLTGPGFALLRKEFSDPVAPKPISTQATNVLVTLGGSDPLRLTVPVLEALKTFDTLELKVVLGPEIAGTFRDEHERANIELIRSRWEMRPLMEWADIAIAAAGSVSMELCRIGVPMISMVTSPNQERIASALDAEGVASNLGWPSDTMASRLSNAVAELAPDASRRALMSARGRSLVDGRGGDRVVSIMRSFL